MKALSKFIGKMVKMQIKMVKRDCQFNHKNGNNIHFSFFKIN